MGKSRKSDIKQLEAFKTKFTENYILDEMQIDDYIIGKGLENTFCYLIEGKSNFIGWIKGANV